ncbi:hypothetical protein SAMN05444392_103248 [Seinonella peptonophila]|uniref:Uncharacterized protein n=1 Tax=Seinonella peptonophila TaxID=112248 RepID=A0A1M4WJG0_9BACL|nr:hypothetical protein [Seinonella peptonophila]SHE81334.1 hypothetical protein SAMN05444392_103248 [Seinonella peptonophila]
MEEITWFCPVCNGFSTIDQDCSNCGSPLIDQGRLFDFFDPYAPYRPIDALKMSDGISFDYAGHQCPHTMLCPICQQKETFLIKEQNDKKST